MEMYTEIRYLPYHVSQTRQHMLLSKRTAQFAPFTPLEGYNDLASETARYASSKKELDEDARMIIDLNLQVLSAKKLRPPEGRYTYFVKDHRKDGGAYVTVIGCISHIDKLKKLIILKDSTTIPIDDLMDVEIV